MSNSSKHSVINFPLIFITSFVHFSSDAIQTTLHIGKDLIQTHEPRHRPRAETTTGRSSVLPVPARSTGRLLRARGSGARSRPVGPGAPHLRSREFFLLRSPVSSRKRRLVEIDDACHGELL